jgi:hypothetical protein
LPALELCQVKELVQFAQMRDSRTELNSKPIQWKVTAINSANVESKSGSAHTVETVMRNKKHFRLVCRVPAPAGTLGGNDNARQTTMSLDAEATTVPFPLRMWRNRLSQLAARSMRSLSRDPRSRNRMEQRETGT